MDRTCRMYDGEITRHTDCWWRNLKETDHLEDTGVDGMKILKGILQKQNGCGVDWIHLAQCKDK